MKSSGSRLLVGVAAIALAGSFTFAQQIEVNKGNRTIAVTATDKATADADTAIVHIGFQVFAADEKAAYALGSKTSNAIANALKKAGVPDDSIESENQSIARVQPFELQNLPENQRAERQFQVTQGWTVKGSAKNAAAILDTAVQAGANQSGQIDWELSGRKELQAAAAGNALKKANEIARQMANGMGVKLGALIYASNQMQEIGPRPVVQRNEVYAKLSAPPAPMPLAVSPRRIDESASVYAVFAIE